MKFTDDVMDFEIPKAKLGNYFYGNLIMPKSRVSFFDFPSELQSQTFKFEKLVFDSVSMTYSFVYDSDLNVTYKKTGYFEAYNLVTDLDIGYYRITAGTFYSKSLIDVRNITVADYLTYHTFIDNLNDPFVDDLSEYLIENI